MEAATLAEADTVVTAVMGVAGLEPTLAAIRQGKRIALANKETMVCAGDLVMDEADRYGAEIVPVDSEHSAIFQCLQGCRDRGEVRRLILTASGGPFFGWSREQLARVTKAQALRHPNWAMGDKITIDSATLMNKGLELIEAMRLYRMPPEKISIVIHRESIVHSLVEYCDNAVIGAVGRAGYAPAHPVRPHLAGAGAGPGGVTGPVVLPAAHLCRPGLRDLRMSGTGPSGGRAGAARRRLCSAEPMRRRWTSSCGRKIGFLDIPRRVERGSGAGQTGGAALSGGHPSGRPCRQRGGPLRPAIPVKETEYAYALYHHRHSHVWSPHRPA